MLLHSPKEKETKKKRSQCSNDTRVIHDLPDTTSTSASAWHLALNHPSSSKLSRGVSILQIHTVGVYVEISYILKAIP